MPEVYRAAPPPPEPEYHTCDYPGQYGDGERPIGSIWKCGGCGKYWRKYSMRGITVLGGPGRNWDRVYWWHWRRMRKIKQAEADAIFMGDD